MKQKFVDDYLAWIIAFTGSAIAVGVWIFKHA